MTRKWRFVASLHFKTAHNCQFLSIE